MSLLENNRKLLHRLKGMGVVNITTTSATSSSSPNPFILTNKISTRPQVPHLRPLPSSLFPFPPPPPPFISSLHYYSSSPSLTCWKCSKHLDKTGEFSYLLCPSCGVPQPVGGVVVGGINYFVLLGVPESYSVDNERLNTNGKRLQRRLHPDLFAGGSDDKAQEFSQDLSSLVNKAVSTLLHPIERGRYMLKLNGVEDPTGDVEKEMTNDPEFLGEVMELNERLEELRDEGEWREFRRENDMMLDKLQRELCKAFEGKDIAEAKLILAKMKYFDTLQGKLKELKTKLSIVE